MKKNLFLLLLSFFCLTIITSYSTGAANTGGLNCTGSYVSPDNCAGSGCHSANTGDVNINLFLIGALGDTVKNFRYVPGAHYNIVLGGSVFGGTFPKYSFQFSGQSEHLNGGTFTMSTGLHQTVVGSAKIVEPTNPFMTGTNNSFQSTILYQAPGGGTQNPGKWTLFATVLVANDDNSPSNDKANNIQVTYSPIPVSVGSIDEKVSVTLFPNPVRDRLTLKLEDADAGEYTMGIFNTQGQILKKQQFTVSSSVFSTSVSAAEWPAGTYTLELMKDGKRRITRFVKL